MTASLPTKLGFDNEKYLREQGDEIRRRAGKFGKLYLEFGGKLMNDFHAARCLPGYDPNVKLRLLQSLKASELSPKQRVPAASSTGRLGLPAAGTGNAV